MKNQYSEKEITAALKRFSAKPSAAWQEEIRTEIRALAVTPREEERIQERNASAFFSSLFWNPMKRILLPASALALLLIGTLFYSGTTAPSAFEVHLQNARIALTKVEAFAAQGALSDTPAASFFTRIYAAESDEMVIAELVAEVRTETSAALGEVALMDDLELKINALAAIVALQEKTLEVVSDALLRLQNTAVIDAIALSLEATVDENGRVETEREQILTQGEVHGKAHLKVQDDADDPDDVEATAEGESSMMMQADESSEQDQSADADGSEEAKLQIAQELMADVEISIDDLPANAQKKWAALQDILEACADQDDPEKCQAGKAKGLAIALSAKVRQELREREQHDDDDENDDEDEDEDGLKKRKFPPIYPIDPINPIEFEGREDILFQNRIEYKGPPLIHIENPDRDYNEGYENKDTSVSADSDIEVEADGRGDYSSDEDYRPGNIDSSLEDDAYLEGRMEQQ